jgi:hypothetical protein
MKSCVGRSMRSERVNLYLEYVRETGKKVGASTSLPGRLSSCGIARRRHCQLSQDIRKARATQHTGTWFLL